MKLSSKSINESKCPICGKLVYISNDGNRACSDIECVFSVGEKEYFNNLTEEQWEEDKLNAFYKQVEEYRKVNIR